jgi:nucleoside-diphosphate-sugar epimerase
LIIDDVKENCKSNINAFELDVASLPSIQTLDLDYDILCYFPSEKIFGKVGSFFDIQRFEDFYKIYCVAFNEIARRFLQGGGKKIYYPSSVAVMSSVRGLEEYAYAKKIGEEICKSLEAEFDAEIICERLERIETRQTLSVMPTAARDPVDVAIDICSKFSL